MHCRPAGTGEAASAGRPSGLAQALAAGLLLLAMHLATRPLWRLSGCCDAALGQPHSELTDDVMDHFLAPLKANRAPGECGICTSRVPQTGRPLPARRDQSSACKGSEVQHLAGGSRTKS